MRRLSGQEQAFAVMNHAFPMPAVIVLKFITGPSKNAIRQSLDHLQYRHPLLRASITKLKKEFWFQELNPIISIPLEEIIRKNDGHWLEVVNVEINKKVIDNPGPLLKSIYLTPSKEKEDTELLLVFHHSIIDSVSLIALINELLTYAGQIDKNITPVQSTTLPVAPIIESILPGDYKGIRLLFRLIPFMAKQLKDEIIYNKGSKKLKDLPIPLTSDNNVLTVVFTKETTTALIKWSRQNKISLNSLIAAAMLLAIHRRYYFGKDRLMRHMNFANLRPYLLPPVNGENEGCYVSMMRFMLFVAANSTVEEIAFSLHQKINKTLKKGDKFIFPLLSKMLIKQTLRKYNSRVSQTLFSYAGAIAIKEEYDNIKLSGVHSFVANNHLGPIISGFGKICFGKLSLDLNFLSDEVSGDKAVDFANEIKVIMEELILNK